MMPTTTSSLPGSPSSTRPAPGGRGFIPVGEYQLFVQARITHSLVFDAVGVDLAQVFSSSEEALQTCSHQYQTIHRGRILDASGFSSHAENSAANCSLAEVAADHALTRLARSCP
jgi:hypothetical protein